MIYVLEPNFLRTVRILFVQMLPDFEPPLGPFHCDLECSWGSLLSVHTDWCSRPSCPARAVSHLPLLGSRKASYCHLAQLVHVPTHPTLSDPTG